MNKKKRKMMFLQGRKLFLINKRRKKRMKNKEGKFK